MLSPVVTPEVSNDIILTYSFAVPVVIFAEFCLQTVRETSFRKPCPVPHVHRGIYGGQLKPSSWSRAYDGLPPAYEASLMPIGRFVISWGVV